jgi:hypothetical protein
VSGRLLASIIVVFSLLFGVALYYTQVYAYYDRIAAEDVNLTLVNAATNEPEPFIANDIEAIDGSSSPIRFRACFTSAMSTAAMTETYVTYPDPTPLNAPGWFDCFDAQEIGAALEDGQAVAFLGEKNIHDGVDRVIAVYPDGRAFAWHQLNEKYDEDSSQPFE